jgi:hypothetical protein
MCTVVILRRPGHDWPVLIAANRDEMLGRPWRPPGRHWPDRAEVVAGLDVLAGGSWMGLNDHGVVACMLNRTGSLGPAPDKRSRGELVLEALDHADAADAVRALSALEPASYRPFNMLVADNRDAFWLKAEGGAGSGRIGVFPIPTGHSMLTANDLNDPASPRVRRHLPRFRAAPTPEPGGDDPHTWFAWQGLLGDRRRDPPDDPRSAMNIDEVTGFGTSSASLLAVPAVGTGEPLWLFAAGRPHETEFLPVVGG